MGLLDIFRPQSAPRRAEARRAELFDDDFQKKLESLAIVSRRVFGGRDARRSAQQEEGQRRRVPPTTATYTAGDDFRTVDWERLPTLRTPLGAAVRRRRRSEHLLHRRFIELDVVR